HDQINCRQNKSNDDWKGAETEQPDAPPVPDAQWFEATRMTDVGSKTLLASPPAFNRNKSNHQKQESEGQLRSAWQIRARNPCGVNRNSQCAHAQEFGGAYVIQRFH